MTLSQTNGFAAVFGDVRVPDAQPSRVGATAATSSAAAASHRLHFVDHDLTKRQRALLVVSVFVTALLVTYLTGIRPGFKKPGFYVTVLHYVADGIVYPFKVLWHLLC